jgi:hypothetical protein
MRQRSLASSLVLSLILLSFLAVYPASLAARPGGMSDGGPASLPTNAPNAVVLPTTTVTNTTTVTVTSVSGTITISVHVVNQYGLWINGAEVEVFLQQPGVPTAFTLVANGTTENGHFFARNLTAFSTYNIQVYAPTGGTGSQTVTVSNNDAVLVFTIAASPPPIMAVQNVSLNPGAAGPSSPFALTATVVNVSNSTAYNTVLSITPPPQFSLLNTGSVIPLGTMAPGSSKSLTLALGVSSTATTNGYTVAYSLSFTDYSGLVYTTPGSVYLPSPLPPSLVLQKVILNPSIVQPGISFSLAATVVNVSNSTAYNAVLSLTPPAQFSFLNTGAVIPLGTMAPGSSKNLSLALSVSSATTTNGYAVSYTLSFTDYFLNKLSNFGNLFIPVSGNAVHPNLIVTAATFSPQVIHSGDSFALQMKIENVGLAPALQAVLSVNTTNPIATVGSAGNYRFGNVAANGTISQSVSLSAPLSTRPGSYPLTLTLSFVDTLGAVYTTQQNIIVNVVGQPSVVFNIIQFKNNPLTPGLQTFFNAQLLNTGGESALSVKVTFEKGPAFLSNITIYLGSIQPGVTGNATAYLHIPSNTALGEYDFNAVVSYFDSSGKSYTVTSPYTMTVAPFSAPGVSITNTLLAPAVLNPGTQGTFTLFLKNDGSTPAYNITISIQNGNGIFTSNLFGLGTLDGSASSTTVTGVNVDPNVQPGNYLVRVQVTYADQQGTPYNFTHPMQITIYSTANLLTLRNIGIGAAAVVIGVVAYVVLRSRFGNLHL